MIDKDMIEIDVIKEHLQELVRLSKNNKMTLVSLHKIMQNVSAEILIYQLMSKDVKFEYMTDIETFVRNNITKDEIILKAIKDNLFYYEFYNALAAMFHIDRDFKSLNRFDVFTIQEAAKYRSEELDALISKMHLITTKIHYYNFNGNGKEYISESELKKLKYQIVELRKKIEPKIQRGFIQSNFRNIKTLDNLKSALRDPKIPKREKEFLLDAYMELEKKQKLDRKKPLKKASSLFGSRKPKTHVR